MTQDRQLQEAVLAEFAWEPSVTAAHIGVIAKDGIVTLTGHVQNYLEKRAAERAAARVKGVKAVVERLEVKLNSGSARSDEDIAVAAANRLDWEVSVPPGAVKIKVEHGWVTLTGQVDWHYQKEAAERHIHGLFGVVGVLNETTIKPRADAVNIGNKIDLALHRSWFDPKTITVTTQGGKVKLSGTVRNAADRIVAGATAWGAPGATDVEKRSHHRLTAESLRLALFSGPERFPPALIVEARECYIQGSRSDRYDGDIAGRSFPPAPRKRRSKGLDLPDAPEVRRQRRGPVRSAAWHSS